MTGLWRIHRSMLGPSRLRAACAVVLVSVAALTSGPSPLAQTVTDSGLVVTPYNTGLIGPTGIRFFGTNQAFVIQKKDGAMRLWQGGALSTVLDFNVQNDSERGLLGIALDPSFASTGHVYLYYSRTTSNGDSGTSSNWASNDLVRYTWNGAAVGTGTTLRTFGQNDASQANDANHDGGPLVFGSDGKLYGATGELNRSRTEQNNTGAASATASVDGIYRLNADGTIPSDAVFPAPFSQWHAYGVRNSFGLALDPVTGRPWDTENGPNSYDEINLVAPRFNSGWNAIMGPDARDPQGVSDLVTLPGAQYADPKFSFLGTIGITSMQFLAGTSWGAGYANGVIFGDANNGQLYLLRLNASRDGFVLVGNLADGVAEDRAERDSLAFGSEFGVVTDMQVGPDGAIYVASLTRNAVYRIAPMPEAHEWMMFLSGLAVLGLVVNRRLTGRAGVNPE